MRTLSELLENNDDMWKRTSSVLDSSSLGPVIVKPVDDGLARQTLLDFQIPAGSMLGSIILNTGGIELLNGKFRLLGTPEERTGRRNLIAWNSQLGASPVDGYLMVADDIFGNFYAINMGKIDSDPQLLGAVFALCPVYSDWALVADKYSEFVEDILQGFWEELLESTGLSNIRVSDDNRANYNLSTSYYPPLFTQEGGLDKSDVRLVGVEESARFALEIRAALF